MSAVASARWIYAAWKSVTFPAEAVIIATGGIGAIFGKSTNSVVCTGSAQSALYQQGAYYANGEFIQVHPTCIPGEDKLRLMSESARGEGGRVWVPAQPGDKRDFKSIPESERWYFLEEWYPKYGNLVPRDIATRAIHKVVYEHHLGIDGQPMVYLDLTHIDRATLDRKLEGILEIYEKFVGDDPRDVPMKIFPGMHYTMGGLWVDFEQKTNIEGLYAAARATTRSTAPTAWGEFADVVHLRRIHRGPRCGQYAHNVIKGGQHPSGARIRFRAQAAGRNQRTSDEQRRHGEPVPAVARTGDTMTKNCTVIRYNKNLQETDAKLVELLERYRHVNLSDRLSGPIRRSCSRGSFITCCNWRG